MKNLVIEKKDAIRLYPTADKIWQETFEQTFGKEMFSKNILDRVKTMDDVYAELAIDKASFEKSFIYKEDLDAAKVRLIIKVFNEGWLPDWNNSNETKYTCYFESKHGGGFFGSYYCNWFTGTDVGSRLCFKSKELALSVPKQFQTEFENYFFIK